MNIEQINKAIINAEPGLTKYLVIMDRFNRVDVSRDEHFQKLYNGFYRVRQRKEDFYKKYFSFMEIGKKDNPSFEQTLRYFHEELGRVEASFSSKLVATINPMMPVWDSIVLQNLKLKKPHTYSGNRIAETVDLYNEIAMWYKEFTNSEEGKQILNLFNNKYPRINITNVKKIDLVLWQMRD